MTRYRVSLTVADLQSPWEKLNAACLWHYKILSQHENHFCLSYKNKMAFFYLSANFLALAGIGEFCEDFERYFSSVAVILALFLLYFCWCLRRVFKKVWAKTVLIGRLHFFIEHRTNAKRWVCLHQFSCSRRLPFKRYNCWYRTGPRLLWVRIQVSGEGSMFFLQPGRLGW